MRRPREPDPIARSGRLHCQTRRPRGRTGVEANERNRLRRQELIHYDPPMCFRNDTSIASLAPASERVLLNQPRSQIAVEWRTGPCLLDRGGKSISLGSLSDGSRQHESLFPSHVSVATGCADLLLIGMSIPLVSNYVKCVASLLNAASRRE